MTILEYTARYECEHLDGYCCWGEVKALTIEGLQAHADAKARWYHERDGGEFHAFIVQADTIRTQIPGWVKAQWREQRLEREHKGIFRLSEPATLPPLSNGYGREYGLVVP